MSRREPIAKVPLAVRKNIRDEWENTREDHEQRISEVLGQPWTISVDPWALYPYAEGTWAQQNLGGAIVEYVQGVRRRLEDYIDYNGNEVRDEINDICSAHVLTIDYDDTKSVSYCGVKISSEGNLVIIFNGDYFGTNTSSAADSDNLTKALNDAPSQRPMSFVARVSIRRGYDPHIKHIQEKLNGILKQEVSLVPNFETNFEKLKSKVSNDRYWEQGFGNTHLSYFEGLASQLEFQKFDQDDMLQEALLEIMPRNAVHFRIVDQTKKTYNEAIVEDGILYLQTTPNHFGSNTIDAASDILSLL